MLPLVRDLEPEGVFLLGRELVELLEASRILGNKCSLFEIRYDFLEIMFSRKLFNIFEKKVPWDIREGVGNSRMAVSRGCMTPSHFPQLLTLLLHSCSN